MIENLTFEKLEQTNVWLFMLDTSLKQIIDYQFVVNQHQAFHTSFLRQPKVKKETTLLTKARKLYYVHDINTRTDCVYRG